MRIEAFFPRWVSPNESHISVDSLQVQFAVQQPGYIRSKRGFKQIRGVPIVDVTAHRNNARPNKLPNDPLYGKQWYIVSILISPTHG